MPVSEVVAPKAVTLQARAMRLLRALHRAAASNRAEVSRSNVRFARLAFRLSEREPGYSYSAFWPTPIRVPGVTPVRFSGAAASQRPHPNQVPSSPANAI